MIGNFDCPLSDLPVNIHSVMPAQEYVYLIRIGKGTYKYGHTSNPNYRLYVLWKELNCRPEHSDYYGDLYGSEMKLILMITTRSINHSLQIERELNQTYKDKRHFRDSRREWVDLSQEDVKRIKQFFFGVASPSHISTKHI